MKRFKNILVVCQEDSQPVLAVERALVLARQNDASVTLVDVVGMHDAEMGEILADTANPSSHDVRARLTHYHQRHLDALRAPLDEAGVTAQTEILWGVGFVEIIRTVLCGEHDLVIKAVNPDCSFNGQRVLSGLDMHLMRKCPCPVWILKDRIDRDDLRVLAAVDPVSATDKGEDLNRVILDLASSICPAENGELHVLHAWTVREERALLHDGEDQADSEEVRRVRSRVRDTRAEGLERLMSHCADGPTHRRVHLLQGLAGEVVPAFVADAAIDLVVMGTVSRTDIPGVFMGDTAEMILNRVACSVLAVKPKGFKTPIEVDQPAEQSGAGTPRAKSALRVA